MADEKVSLEGKPRVLVLGGCGFIGRNLVKYLVENNLASKIRVADKSLPITCHFAPNIEAIFANPVVEYKQADLAQDAHVARVFNDDTGPYRYVINLAGETRLGLPELVYQEKCVSVAVKSATAALRQGCERFVEVSTAQIYDPDTGKISNEESPLRPFTIIGRARLDAEEALRKIEGLPLSVVRPAIVYGPGDVTGLTPRMAVGAVYKKKEKKMKILWDKDLHIHTVHVVDVVRGIWHVATNLPPGVVYNLADRTNMDQGRMNEYIGNLFGIRTGFLGTALSTLAKLHLKTVADDANEEHVPVWSRLCEEYNVVNTPVSPFIDKGLLHHNDIWIDGSAICQTGFEYLYPEATQDLVAEQVRDFISRRLFPPVLTNA